MHKDYKKFTPAPRRFSKEEREEFLQLDDNLKKFDEQLLVWGRAHLTPLEPRAGLLDRIIYRIQQEERLMTLRNRLVVFSIGLVGSLAALVSIFGALQAGLAQSGLAQFLSLIFSDPNVVLASGGDFALSILESLPVVSLTAFFAVSLIFLGSLKFLVADSAVALNLSRSANN